MWYLYGIECGTDAIKLGISQDPSKRLESLQVANHQWLTLAFQIMVANRKDKAEAIEARIHDQFSLYHIRGEWFRFGITKRIVGQLLRKE